MTAWPQMADGGPPGAHADTPGASGNPELGVGLMVASAVLVCVGQAFWKVGASHGWLWIGLGFVLYGLGALLMLIAYRHGELGVLQPILGLSYALSLFIGVVWLDETLTALRVTGVALVVIGVAVLARSSARRPT